MKPISDTAILTTPEYRQFIEDLKARVTAARISAARAVNRDLILLYWDIGRGIVEKQRTLGWGESVVEMVSADLRASISPAMTGFSAAQCVATCVELYETYHCSGISRTSCARDIGEPILRQIAKRANDLGDKLCEIDG